MKKILAFLLCCTMLFGISATAFADDGGIITGEYGYVASTGFLYNKDSVRSFRYSDDYFRHSGYVYDHDLAIMSMDLNSSGDKSIEGDWAQSNRNFIDLMQKCGFVDIDANQYITDGPTPDSIGVNIASKQLDDCTLLAVALRGHGYTFEWASNFTVGSSGDHQGFSEASVIALDYIREYIAEYGVSGKLKLWITGYSRSAVVANLVGGAIDKGFDFGEGISFDRNDLYCYTFEAPQGTADPNCRSELYYNIHNIVNVNDLVTYVSPSAWGHDRYGIDYRLPCRQYDGEYYYQLKRSVNEIFCGMETMMLGSVPINFIDDFHYLSLDPITALKKQNITQIEFYGELTDLLINVLAPTRNDYVNNAQSDMRELGAVLFGGKDNLSEILPLFAEKFVSLDNLSELYADLVRDDPTGYERAVLLVENIMLEAMGEKAYASYDSAKANEMLYNLAKTFIEMFRKSPDTVLTLSGNLLQILNAHFAEMGRAWLTVTPAEFFTAQGKAFVPPHEHEADAAKYHAAQPASCTEPGSLEYYECAVPGCSAMLDADGNELIDPTVPVDGNAHSFSADWSFNETEHFHASVCGHEFTSDVGSHADTNKDHKCDVCLCTMTVCADAEGDGLCDICGKAMYEVGLSVSTSVAYSLLKLPVSCTYRLIPKVTGASVKLVQYSLDGGRIWLFGTVLVTPAVSSSFKVRVLDSNGIWTSFSVKNGSVTKL